MGYSITFSNPWLLFLLLPAVALGLLFLLTRKRTGGKKRNRVIAFILYVVTIVCCVFIISGIDIEKNADTVRNEIVLLVDVSDSMDGSENAEIEKQIQSLVSEIKNSEGVRYRVGIVVFAQNPVLASKMTSNFDRLLLDYDLVEMPEGNATDISEALVYANEQFSGSNKGRIILLTDGRETDGNAFSTIGAIAENGTRVDVVYLTPAKYDREMQITDVKIPENYAIGDKVTLTACIDSVSAGNAALKFYANDELVTEKYVELEDAGTFNVEFEYDIISVGLHSFRFELVPEADAVEENNQYVTFINIDSDSKILILEGEKLREDGTRESDKLVSLFQDNENLEFEVAYIEDAPKTLTKLRSYDEVILMNVLNASMPYGFDELLHTYVSEYGGGLLTIGGDNAYRSEDMKGSLLEEMLPVISNNEAKPVSIVIVMDASGSMNGTPIEKAKEGAKRCIEALSGRDYVGVISFDTEYTNHTGSALVPASQKQTLYDAVDDINAGGGTQYEAALQQARALLLNAKTPLRHVLFLTDGMPQDPESSYMHVVENMKKEGIVVSTFGISAEGGDPNLEVLEKISSETGGSHYVIDNLDKLPEIVEQVAYRAQSDWKIREQFYPRIVSANPVVGNLENLPLLNGYYSVLAKSEAFTLIESRNSSLDPILAYWNYGKGRVCSFMSDLRGELSDQYYLQDSGIKLIENIVQFSISAAADTIGDIEMNVERDNFDAVLQVNTDTSGGETVTAVLELPDGSQKEISFAGEAKGPLSARLDSQAPGLYRIIATKRDARGRVTAEETIYFAVSYSLEYSVFTDDGACYSFLQELCAQTGGSVYTSEQPKFGKDAQSDIYSSNIQMWLMIIGVACFLLEIAARKFSFKFPHEIIRERRARKKSKNL